MRTRLPLLLLAVLVTCPGGAATAGVPPRAPPTARRPKATSCVSLVKRRGGERALVIDYPWKVHRRPSVEVRLVTGKDPGPSVVRPLFFVNEYMKGEVKVTLYRAEDASAGGKVRKPLTEKEVEFEILGRRNSLGKPSVCVVHRFAAKEPAPGTTAVYCLLPAWAINKKLLYLDLPREDFVQPGKLYVWFLRDDRVLWTEAVEWPGYEKRRTATDAQPGEEEEAAP